MQKSKNATVRALAYSKLNDPKKMFVQQPQLREEPRTIRLDFARFVPVRPNMVVRANFAVR